MAKSSVYVFSSDDDFIADGNARKCFDELSKLLHYDMSKEIIDGNAKNINDAISICSRAMESCATLPMFDVKKTVWLKGVNFINSKPYGGDEELAPLLDNFAKLLERLDPERISVVVSASPSAVKRDRRGTVKYLGPFAEYLGAFADFKDYEKTDSEFGKILKEEAEKLNVTIGNDAIETLSSIVAGDIRMAVQELQKLAAYVNFTGEITKDDVSGMVPIFGEGEFFDISNAFYSGNLEKALSSLGRYFFANKNASARPVIASLQKTNSLLIQLRSLMDSGVLRKTTAQQPHNAMESASEKYAEYFGEAKDKSHFNLFSQNPWYAEKILAPIAARIPLRKLVDIQMNIVKAFGELSTRGAEEDTMRDMFVRCLKENGTTPDASVE